MSYDDDDDNDDEDDDDDSSMEVTVSIIALLMQTGYSEAKLELIKPQLSPNMPLHLHDSARDMHQFLRVHLLNDVKQNDKKREIAARLRIADENWGIAALLLMLLNASDE